MGPRRACGRRRGAPETRSCSRRPAVPGGSLRGGRRGGAARREAQPAGAPPARRRADSTCRGPRHVPPATRSAAAAAARRAGRCRRATAARARGVRRAGAPWNQRWRSAPCGCHCRRWLLPTARPASLPRAPGAPGVVAAGAARLQAQQRRSSMCRGRHTLLWRRRGLGACDASSAPTASPRAAAAAAQARRRTLQRLTGIARSRGASAGARPHVPRARTHARAGLQEAPAAFPGRGRGGDTGRVPRHFISSGCEPGRGRGPPGCAHTGLPENR